MSEVGTLGKESERSDGSRTAVVIALTLAGVAMALLAWSLVAVIIEGQRPEYGFFLHSTSALYSALGVLIIYHQPRNIVGWLILLVGFLGAFSVLPVDQVAVLSSIESEIVLIPLVLIGELTWILPLLIPLTFILQFFPDGRLPSPRWRVVTVVTILAILGFGLLNAAETIETLRQGTLRAATPAPIEGNLKTLENLVSVLTMASILGSLASFVVRFRRSQGAERAQVKWLAYMVITGVSVFFLALLITGEDSTITSIVFAYLPTWLALAMGIAILRYQLFDIDIIIRRTLQYGLLTAVLIAVYFGVVLLVQWAFVAVTGEESPIAIVISTLVIAALFNPLRRRIQEFINHRFYRKRYDAALTLQQFAETAREEVDLDHLSGVLMGSINETMQPETAVLWLKPGEEL